MTRKQKREVDHLRIIGVSASDIASQLGLSVNTVRSYFFGIRWKEARPPVLSVDVQL